MLFMPLNTPINIISYLEYEKGEIQRSTSLKNQIIDIKRPELYYFCLPHFVN